MKALITLLALHLLTGCVGTPGHVSKTKSTFDNSTEIRVEPAWVIDGMNGGFKLGLHYNSAMPASNVVMTAVVKGAESIADGESLKFNINGVITSLTSIDQTTDIQYNPGLYNSVAAIPGSSWSSKRYRADIAFIRRLVESETVTARLELSRGYAEGKFSTDAPTTARPAFRRFLKVMENPQTNSVTSPDSTSHRK